jgi:hypothetical protein
MAVASPIGTDDENGFDIMDKVIPAVATPPSAPLPVESTSSPVTENPNVPTEHAPLDDLLARFEALKK